MKVLFPSMMCLALCVPGFAYSADSETPVRQHATFLKGVTDTVENMDVRFATPDVAVVTVTSRTSAYITPDGIKHPENEGVIRTFVVVKKSARWLIMQDQNTIIGQDIGVR